MALQRDGVERHIFRAGVRQARGENRDAGKIVVNLNGDSLFEIGARNFAGRFDLLAEFAELPGRLRAASRVRGRASRR